jgi:alpha-tubulin suppressor-like RCC1 family protein
MTVNIGNLEKAIAVKIASTTGVSDLSLLATAIKQLKSNQVWSVPCSSCLPSAAANIGKLFYVENECRIYFAKSATDGWLDLGKQGGSVTKLNIWGECTTSAFSGVSSVPAGSTGCFFDILGGGSDWCFVASGTSTFGSPVAAAIKTNGTLWTWGRNCYTILGSGQAYSTSRCSPGTTAGGGTNWCMVSTRLNVMGAIKTDGTLWTWGSNANGGTGTGTSFGCQNSPFQVSGGGTTWCFISIAGVSGSGIKTDGTLWTWGRNSSGELGDSSFNNRSSPGGVAGTGTTWTKVSISGTHTIAVKTDGTLWTWGSNNYGRLGIGSSGSSRNSPGTTAGGGTDWCLVSSSYSGSSAAIKTDGTLWMWGKNSCGILGDVTTSNRSSPSTVAGGGTTWSTICIDNYSSGAIKTDGTLWTWGRNDFGQLANGNTAHRSSPGTTVSSATNWFRISIGKPSLGIQCINI